MTVFRGDPLPDDIVTLGWPRLFRRVLLLSPLAWLLAGLLRLWPRLNDLERAATWGAGDDWWTYRRSMEAILAGQWLGTPDAIGVASLAYPYELAALALLVGPAPANLYVVIHGLIGAAVAVFAALAARLWGPRGGWIVLAVLTPLAIVDVARYYAVVFLAENVVLLVLGCALLALHRYLGRPTAGSAVLAGALLGLTALTRFSLLPFGVVVVGWVMFRRNA